MSKEQSHDKPASEADHKFKTAIMEYVKARLNAYMRDYPESSQQVAMDLEAGGSIALSIEYGVAKFICSAFVVGKDGSTTPLGGFRFEPGHPGDLLN